MHHLTKSLSRVALFAILSVLLEVCLNGFIRELKAFPEFVL